MTQVSGEEIVPIPFQNGLFISEVTDDIPDGYNSTQKNLFLDDLGHLSLRTSMAELGTFNNGVAREDVAVVKPLTQYPPDYPYDYLRRAHSVNKATTSAAGVKTYYPSIIVPRLTNAGAADVAKLWSAASDLTAPDTPVVEDINKDIYFSGCAQYKDRIYMCGLTTPFGTVGGIGYVTGWDYTGTAGALTFTSVATIQMEGLVTFRDRIFGWRDGILYYTEVAAVGGYCENWNFGNNAITVQSAEETCVIFNVLVYNDKLYIFTDRGLYQLYAVGAPTGWYLQTVSRDHKIFGRHGAAFVKDTLVFTDRNKIYIFNGDGFQEIGKEIDIVVNQATSVTIFPFQDGVMVSCYIMSQVSDTRWDLTSSRHFYFNGGNWAEFAFYDSTATQITNAVFLGIWALKALRTFSSKFLNDMAVVLRQSTVTGIPDIYIAYYTANNSFTDLFTGATPGVVGELVTKKISLNPYGYVRGKYSYMEFTSFLNRLEERGFTIEASTVVADTPVNPLTLANPSDFQHILKIKGPGYCRKFAFNLKVKAAVITSNTVAAPSNIRTYFKLKSLATALHSENRDVIDKDNV